MKNQTSLSKIASGKSPVDSSGLETKLWESFLSPSLFFLALTIIDLLRPAETENEEEDGDEEVEENPFGKRRQQLLLKENPSRRIEYAVFWER